MTIRKWAGVKLVAVGSLKWSCRGELMAFGPGDIFELEAADLAVPGVDPDFWLKVGAVKEYVAPKPEPKPDPKAKPPRPGATEMAPASVLGPEGDDG